MRCRRCPRQHGTEPGVTATRASPDRRIARMRAFRRHERFRHVEVACAPKIQSATSPQNTASTYGSVKSARGWLLAPPRPTTSSCVLMVGWKSLCGATRSQIHAASGFTAVPATARAPPTRLRFLSVVGSRPSTASSVWIPAWSPSLIDGAQRDDVVQPGSCCRYRPSSTTDTVERICFRVGDMNLVARLAVTPGER